MKIDFSGRSGKISGRSVSGVREGSLLKRGRLRQTSGEGHTRWRSLSGTLVWRMAHRRTAGRGGEHSEMTDIFASLVFGDSSNPP